jgi:hypothetical protein
MSKTDLVLEKEEYLMVETVHGTFRLIHGSSWLDKPFEAKIGWRGKGLY